MDDIRDAVTDYQVGCNPTVLTLLLIQAIGLDGAPTSNV